MSKKLTDETYSLRAYLIAMAMQKGTDFFTALEAVSSTAIEHPEWNLDEKRTWQQWEMAYGTSSG